ncbi:FtsX-like permease family protein [uncultured Thermomonospora sp.]|uniref:FtsX-like permease family protein n=1 Tax=uncultured Thermomonospora sp. TaxID=671175 RepID=UPI00259B7D71|nr:FtsX-like permease family protein [uncultured Thermomonospora sp.]
MLSLSWGTLRERRWLFAGAVSAVALGVALVQSSLLTLVATGEPQIPPGTSGREAEQIREGYVGAATLLGMTVLLAAFLAVFIVGSTFAFTVAQRRRDLALLRLAGGSRRQLVVLLLTEALLLGLAGTVLGVLLGVPAMWAQAWLLVRLGFLPGHFTVGWSAGVLPVSAGVGLGVAVCGVLAAALRAARLRPLDAVRDSGAAARVMTAGRWLVGLSCLALAAPLVVAGQSADFLGALLVAMAVSMLGAVAFSMLSPLLVPPAGWVLGSALRRAGVLGELAEANLREGTRRSAATAAPLIVLVALTAGFAGTLDSLAAATGVEIRRLTAGDLVVESTGAQAARLRQIPGVAVASTRLSVEISIRAEHREEGRTWRHTYHSGIVAIDPDAYQRTQRLRPAAGSLDRLRGATVAIGPGLAAEPIRRKVPPVARIGDRRVRLRIVAVMPEVLENGADAFLVPRELIPDELAARSPAETIVQVAPGASVQEVAARIRAADLGTVRTVSEWADARVAAQTRGNRDIMLVLLGMSGLYAAIAVVNALVMAGAERRTEFAVARLTGLSRGQVVRAALVESCAVIAIGLLLGGLVAAAALSGLQVIAVPWTLLFWLAAGAFLVGGATTVLTAWWATRPAPVTLAAARE